jgi:hypothetical protein
MSNYIVSPNKPIVTLAEVESPVIEKIVASFPIENEIFLVKFSIIHVVV